MKARAGELVPTPATAVLWHSNADFFHVGTSGQWRDLLDPVDLARYEARLAELVEPDLAAWAHRGRRATEPEPEVAAAC
jgi:hypothetical protein